MGGYNCSSKVSKLSGNIVTASTTARPSDHKGVKLPKLEVPTFYGNILNWRRFWEQFSVSVHGRSNLSDSESPACTQGSAKVVIESLSQSGENNKEAVECLQARYDRPHLIHRTHVKMIIDASPLRDSTGKELRKLHDVVQQHLRALKAMGYEPSSPFVTAVLELKLDTTNHVRIAET